MAELADMPDKVFMSVRSMQAIDKAIAESDVKTVLEYGSGFSTYWFARRVEKVYTVEWNHTWIPYPIKNITVIFTPRLEEFYLGTLDFVPHCDLILIDNSRLDWRIEIFKRVRNWDWKVLCVHDWNDDYPWELYDGLEKAKYDSLQMYFKEWK